MKHIFLLIVCIICLASTCKKGDCHTEILIENKSDYDLIITRLETTIMDGGKKCNLVGNGYIVAKQSSISYRPFSTCIEKKNSGIYLPMEIYLVDINKFNKAGFYDCDSIYIKNNVLKKYRLTMDTLIKTDFTIIFQP
jgi:hypothetical protein